MSTAAGCASRSWGFTRRTDFLKKVLKPPCASNSTLLSRAMEEGRYQTSAQTSCCSVPNLTLASAAQSDGTTSWARVVVSGGADGGTAGQWTSWAGALQNSGCSAGAEGQDPLAADSGSLNWFNKSVRQRERASTYLIYPRMLPVGVLASFPLLMHPLLSRTSLRLHPWPGEPQ